MYFPNNETGGRSRRRIAGGILLSILWECHGNKNRIIGSERVIFFPCKLFRTVYQWPRTSHDRNSRNLLFVLLIVDLFSSMGDFSRIRQNCLAVDVYSPVVHQSSIAEVSIEPSSGYSCTSRNIRRLYAPTTRWGGVLRRQPTRSRHRNTPGRRVCVTSRFSMLHCTSR